MSKTDAVVNELEVNLPNVHAISPELTKENSRLNNKQVDQNFATT